MLKIFDRLRIKEIRELKMILKEFEPVAIDVRTEKKFLE